MFSVIQQLFNKGSTFWAKKLAILDKKLATFFVFILLKRVQKRVNRVAIFT
jgi:hypothetical protein